MFWPCPSRTISGRKIGPPVVIPLWISPTKRVALRPLQTDDGQNLETSWWSSQRSPFTECLLKRVASALNGYGSPNGVCSSFRICTFVCISRLLIVVEQVLGRLELVEALAICWLEGCYSVANPSNHYLSEPKTACRSNAKETPQG